MVWFLVLGGGFDALVWWHERVSTAQALAWDFVFVPCRRWFGAEVALWLARRAETLVWWLLLGGLFWPIIRSRLQARWALEVEEEDRRDRQARQEELRRQGF